MAKGGDAVFYRMKYGLALTEQLSIGGSQTHK